MLICIEGIDSSGKNTQAQLLAKHLERATLAPTHLYSFPRYDTRLGELIRSHLVREVALRRWNKETTEAWDYPISTEDSLMFQCLMLADKYDAAVSIRGDLAAGRHVVCDRWIPSSQCYGKADQLDPAWLERMHSALPVADLNIFLNISPEEALNRRPEARDRYERDRAKQAVVRTNYDQLWKAHESDPAWVIVDGESSKSTLPDRIDEVATRIWLEVLKRWKALS